MEYSRRELWRLLPALAVAGVRLGAAENASLPAKAYRFEDLAAKREGENAFRAIFDGRTRTGFALELHESDLAPGAMPHPAHHHVHEEIFLVQEGTLEVTLGGETTRLGPGSAAFVASNVEHGIRNAGSGHAQYFVLGLGNDKG